jgi:glycosyltransferase involved in cell wall biosynthesis
MRILRLIARLNVGGPAKHVAWLMTGLNPERFSQTLAAGRVEPGEDDMGPWVRSKGVQVTTLPRLGRAINPCGDLICLFQILSLLIFTKPHILATHTSKAGFLGRAALLLYRPLARIFGWPRPRAVHTFHGHTFHGYFGPAKAKVFLWLERFLAKFATWRIVVISQRQLEEISQTYRVGRPGQFALVPLGVDLAPFAETDSGRRRFRAELGAKAGEILVGAVGRVAPVKNYGLFLATAARLGQLRPELFARCRFLLIGGGPPEDLARLKEQAHVLGLADKVFFLGNRKDPEAFFPGLDALLLTSVNEGTPVAILEGGACGLPVAATCVGGVPDILGEAQSEPEEGGVVLRERGITAPSKDAEALARGVIWLMDHPHRARELGRNLARHVRTGHDKSRLLAQITGLYEQALK